MKRQLLQIEPATTEMLRQAQHDNLGRAADCSRPGVSSYVPKGGKETAGTAITERGYSGEGVQAGPSVARTLWRAGCLFNSKAGGHGREPTSRGRFLLRQGYGGQVGAARGFSKHVFLRNEPTVFSDKLLCITHIVRCLWRLQSRFAGGFVLENEPTGGVFKGGERRNGTNFQRSRDG